MNNVLVAVGLLLEQWDRFEESAAQYRALIKKAREEGRDITDEELEELRQRSRESLDRWLDGTG